MRRQLQTTDMRDLYRSRLYHRFILILHLNQILFCFIFVFLIFYANAKGRLIVWSGTVLVDTTLSYTAFDDTLQIMPGTKVYFLAEATPPVSLRISYLFTQGQNDSTGAIIFTSSRDTSSGSPNKADWGRVLIGDTPTPMKFCYFKYATVGAELLTFANAESCQFSFNRLGCSYNLSSISFLDFYNNDTAMLVGYTLPMSKSNLPTKSSRQLVQDITGCTFQNSVDGIINLAGQSLFLRNCTFINNYASITTFNIPFPGQFGSLYIYNCQFQALNDNRFGIIFSGDAGGVIRNSKFVNNGSIATNYSAILGIGGASGPDVYPLDLGISAQESAKNEFLGFVAASGDLAVDNQFERHDTIYARNNFWDSVDSTTIAQLVTGKPVAFYPFLSDTPTDVQDGGSVRPTRFGYLSCFPNPFNSTTTITYEARSRDSKEPVALEVFDILGRQVSTVSLDKVGPTRYKGIWNGRNKSGRPLSSGIFLGRVRSAGEKLKMTLLK